MSQSVIQSKTKKLSCSRLPLAVYREIAAHLRQIDGVKASLLQQTAKEFDYLQSQVGGLCLEYLPSPDRDNRVQSILNYYGDKYGSWEQVES